MTLLIAAALSGELASACKACRALSPLEGRGPVRRQGDCGGYTCFFLRTGIGMGRAARRLEAAIAQTHPSAILVTGYAGALDPALQAGDLLIARRVWAPAGGAPVSWKPGAGEDLELAARAANLAFRIGEILTVPRPVGRAAQKARLFRAFRAAAVDMETAALARVAAERAVPFRCVRAVSDRAGESLAFGFLLPRAGVAAARRTLEAFFAAYFPILAAAERASG